MLEGTLQFFMCLCIYEESLHNLLYCHQSFSRLGMLLLMHIFTHIGLSKHTVS
jgi:hypothetical protein